MEADSLVSNLNANTGIIYFFNQPEKYHFQNIRIMNYTLG